MAAACMAGKYSWAISPGQPCPRLVTPGRRPGVSRAQYWSPRGADLHDSRAALLNRAAPPRDQPRPVLQSPRAIGPGSAALSRHSIRMPPVLVRDVRAGRGEVIARERFHEIATGPLEHHTARVVDSARRLGLHPANERRDGAIRTETRYNVHMVGQHC